jgi:hypothetical protein
MGHYWRKGLVMSAPKYVSLGNWLFQVKEVILRTKNNTVVTLVGNRGSVVIDKKGRASTSGKVKGKAYHKKPFHW